MSSHTPVDFNPLFNRMADKAMAARKGIDLTPVKRGRTFFWPAIKVVIGKDWMTTEEIAAKAGLRIEQVGNTIGRPTHRNKVEKRGSSRSGYEWRVKA